MRVQLISEVYVGAEHAHYYRYYEDHEGDQQHEVVLHFLPI